MSTEVWTCTVCTFDNKNGNTGCEICQSHPPTQINKETESLTDAQLARNLQNQYDSIDDEKVTYWNCSNCRTENEMDLTQCASCYALKYGLPVRRSARVANIKRKRARPNDEDDEIECETEDNNNESSKKKHKWMTNDEKNMAIISKHFVGLSNIDNNCFINVNLQLIFAIMHHISISNGPNIFNDHYNNCKLCEVTDCIICDIMVLFIQIPISNTLLPNQFINSVCEILKINKKDKGTFQDAPEYFRCLAIEFSLTAKSLKQIDPISYYCGGTESEVLECIKCGNKRVKDRDFNMLYIEIANNNIRCIAGALKNYGNTECLENDDAVICTWCCSKTKHTKTIGIIKTPMFLLLCLKRYTRKRKKVRKQISFKMNLNLASIALKKKNERDDILTAVDSWKYNLCYIVRHLEAHYIGYGFMNQTWYKFDDETVSLCHQNWIKKEMIKKEGYVFVYQKAKQERREKHRAKKRISGAEKKENGD